MSRTAHNALHRRGVLGGGAAWSAAALAARADEEAPAQVVAFEEPFDVAQLAVGDWKLLLVEMQPVFVRRRSPEQVARVRAPAPDLPDPARDEDRAPGDGEWLVVSGVCTHAGCHVLAELGPYNGWNCFCHGSTYDLSGRVRHGPAKRNLPVIRHDLQVDGRMTLHAA
jgi:ubiquinol-cytochrome c reductase iron-sulfur subunit